MSELHYPYTDIPEPGAVVDIAPGVKWLRMPMPLSLDHINLYLVLMGDGWMIVDTGLSDKTTQQHWQSVIANHLDGYPIKQVLVTHTHADHIGQAGWLSETYHAPLLMTRTEYLMAQMYRLHGEFCESQFFADYYHRWGVSLDQADGIRQVFGRYIFDKDMVPKSYQRIQHNQLLKSREHEWRVVVGEGHSLEHASLYSKKLNILISGDQILPQITPNVSVSFMEPDTDSLAVWLESIKRFRSLPEDVLVLPAHNLPFTGLHQRLDQLDNHHQAVCDQLISACQQAKNCYQLVEILYPRELRPMDLMLAVAECLSHLNYLLNKGQLQRAENEEGIYLYQAS